ncbi:MAG TPA: hypothetical protein VGV67_14895 [Solirubrobacteraceae bacterium]|nr:hypothetical protein [Solirubrobacteraceae bacterium]
MQLETPSQYDADEDPDTDAATTPDEVEGDSAREQAEGGDEPEEGVGS